MHAKTLRGGQVRPVWLIACVAIATFAFINCIVGWTLLESRNATRHQAEQAAQNVALGLEHEIGQAIEGFDLSLRSAAQGMRLPDLAGLDPQTRQLVLFDGSLASEGFGGVSIADEAGRVIYRSGDGVDADGVLSKDELDEHRADPVRGLAISPPRRQPRTGAWVLVLSRRINHADGSFAGVVSGELRLSFFERMFSALHLGEAGSVSLSGPQGWMVARWPSDAGDPGRDVSASPVFRRMVAAGAGSLTGVSGADGVERLYSFRQVGAFPLMIAVGRATTDLFADWNRRTAVLGAAVLLLGLLGLWLAWALRRVVQRQQAEALSRLDGLFTHSPDAMFVAHVGPDRGIFYEQVNPVWQRMTGVSQSQASGAPPEACWPPEVAAIVEAGWQRCLQDGSPARYSYTLDRDGERHDWDAFVSPVLDKHGQVCRLIGVARDMTDHNRIEAELRQSQRMEAVGQLTAGVAHDFNNLLQAVLGSAELMAGHPELDPEQAECLSVIEQAARRGASLVHRLLAFSRKQPLRPTVLQPQEVLSGLAALLPHTLGHNIRLRVEAEDAVWPVVADRGQLENCLFHLALNARDAMPDGGVLRLSVGNTAGPEGECVRFGVGDDGMGMSSDTANKALEPFFTTKPPGQGTGLGLSMVLGFARQSGGDVRIDSTKGVGTTVSMWLPRAPAAVPPSPAASRPGGAPGRIMLVDDDALVRRTLAMFLRRVGFTVQEVEAAGPALDLLRSGTACDLLVTDQAMPLMAGCELIEQAAVLRPGLPVVLVTGFDAVTGLDRLGGHVAILRKPLDQVALVRHVEALLHSGRVREPAQS